MITREDLSDFFNLTNQENEEKAKELNALELEDKVKARKAIINLRLDSEFKDNNPDGEVRILHCEENISEFKDGEAVELRDQKSGGLICQCNISDFLENGDIEIVINGYNYSSDIDQHTKVDLMLLKQDVSMSNFYWNFTLRSEFLKDDYFKTHLINTRPIPTIGNYAPNYPEENNKGVEKWFGKPLNPMQNIAFVNAEYAEDYFLVQGPPGTGKSYILAMRIFDEINSGKKVVLVGPTHMAINNALTKLAELIIKAFPDSYEDIIRNSDRPIMPKIYRLQD